MQISPVEEKAAMFEDKIASQIVSDGNAKPQELQIESRFGPVLVQPWNAIYFPNGMPGIPGSISFCLTSLPNVKNKQFQLLQCLKDHALSFIVIPSAYDNQILEPVDLDDACTLLGIDPDNLLLLFIVTAHDLPAGRRLSVNAKAPVFVDAISKIAVQYIFPHNHYEIQHFIS